MTTITGRNDPQPLTPMIDMFREREMDAQVIGDFLTHLESQGKIICVQEERWTGDTVYEYDYASVEQRIADFLEIDLKAFNGEKDAIFRWMYGPVDRQGVTCFNCHVGKYTDVSPPEGARLVRCPGCQDLRPRFRGTDLPE